MYNSVVNSSVTKKLWSNYKKLPQNADDELWQCWQSLLGKCFDIMLKTSDKTQYSQQQHYAHSHHSHHINAEQILDYSLVCEGLEEIQSCYPLPVHHNPMDTTVNGSDSVDVTTFLYFEMDNIEGAEYVSPHDNATLQVQMVDHVCGDVILKQATHISGFGDPFDRHMLSSASMADETNQSEPYKLLVDVASGKHTDGISSDTAGTMSAEQPLLSSMSVLLELKRRADYMTSLYFDSFVNFCWWLHNIPPLILRWTIQGWSLFHALLVSCGFGSVKEELTNELWSTPSHLLSKIIEFLKQINPTSICQRIVRLTDANTVDIGVTVTRNSCRESYAINLVPCVACRGWPTFTRQQFAHLPPAVSVAIHRSGYYAVPSSTASHMWKLTFQHAANILYRIISKDPCRVACMKIVYSDVSHISTGPADAGGETGENVAAQHKLTFDHVFTIMLWDYERDADMWSRDSLATRVLWLMEKLQYHVESRALQHYFLPRCNLLHGYSDAYLDAVSTHLQRVLEEPNQYLILR